MRHPFAAAAMALALSSALSLPEPARGADPAPPEAFAERSLTAGRLQAALAHLAAQRAMNAEVRRFAASLARDLDARNERLARILYAIGARPAIESLPDGSTHDIAERTRRFHRLRVRDGAALDRQFLKGVVIGYENALRGYEAAAQSEDDEVKQLAADSLPRLKRDLGEARRLLEQVDERRR